MERSINCYYHCPYYFDHGETESWGCILFGEECKKNKQLDDETCYVHPRRLQYLAYRYNKRCESLEKECTKKFCTEYRKPVTSKKFVQGPFHSGYEVIVNKDFLDSLSKFYRPNMKGGHTHNHVRNATERMRKCKECGDPIVKGMEARIEIPLVRGCYDTMCRCCLKMLDEEIYHHNYETIKEIEMMEADL